MRLEKLIDSSSIIELPAIWIFVLVHEYVHVCVRVHVHRPALFKQEHPFSCKNGIVRQAGKSIIHKLLWEHQMTVGSY